MRAPCSGRMVAFEPRRASPATKRMRAARTCDSSGSLLAMSATMRRQSSVAFGRGARRARTWERMGSAAGPACSSAARLTRRDTLRTVGDEKNYWVRTEQGRTWGPYTLIALERLRGQLTEKCQASLDGATWRPGTEFPELKDLLAPPRKVEKVAPAPSSAPPRISKAMAAAFGIKDEPAPAAEKPAPKAAAARPAPAPQPVPVAEKPLELPESGDLGEMSPLRLYALAALTSASGWLTLELEKGRMLQISFRRGTPEHLSTDDPDHSLVRFLQKRGVVPVEKALAAEEQASKSGQDIVSVLFQMQLIPPADAHKLLGDYAGYLLDRALLSWRGKFSFEKDAPPPPGAFPLGSRWTLLAESVRRLEVPLLRARLGKRLFRPVVRSGGMGIGKVEELALNAQESRLYAAIDGTRTGEELLKAVQDPGVAVRLLYLLTELSHLAFAETHEEKTDPELQPVKPDLGLDLSLADDEQITEDHPSIAPTGPKN